MWMRRFVSCTAFVALNVVVAGAAPFWKTSDLAGDPLFFIQSEGGAPRAQLLCVPESAPVLSDSSGHTVYQEGRDFVWMTGTRDIVLTKGTTIAFKTISELHPPPDAPNAEAHSRDGKSRLFSNNGHLMHTLQVMASYHATARWEGPIPADSGPEKFPDLRLKFKAHAPISLVVLGDSVSTGLNSSRDIAPFQPGYVELVAAGIEKMFGSQVTITNISMSGKRSPWGLARADAAIAANPDLLVCAFGINDATDHVSAEIFSANIAKIVDKVRQAKPTCDFVLVSPMLVNPEWDRSDPALYPAYAIALGAFAETSPSIGFADVTRMWTGLLKKKTLFDLSGNGLCHPNDFGHRVYADVILAQLSLLSDEPPARVSR